MMTINENASTEIIDALLKITINGWKPEYDTIALCWEKDGVIIYATPDWDRNGFTPFECHDEAGREIFYHNRKIAFNQPLKKRVSKFVQLFKEITKNF